MNKLTALLLLVFFITGCGTPGEVKRGEEVSSQGNYIEALRCYETALLKAGSVNQRNEIQRSIETAKSNIVDNALRAASLVYEQSTPSTIQSIDNALSPLENRLQYDDQSSRISRRIKELRSEKKEIYSEIRKIRDEVNDLISNKKYLEALSMLQKAQKRDTADKQLISNISELTVFIEKQKNSYISQIGYCLDNNNGEEAKVLFGKLTLIAPNLPTLKELKDKINDILKKQLFEKISRLKSQNNYYRAYLALTGSEFTGLEEELNRICESGSRYYHDKSVAFFDSGNIHLAYLSSVKAKNLSPNSIEIFQIHQSCKDIIEKELQRHIVIVAFDSPVNEPDAGKLFAGALISKLYKTLPHGISIVEQGETNIPAGQEQIKARQNGDSAGIDMFITGNISVFKTDRIISEQMVNAKIKIGIEENLNPEFSQMVKIYGKNMAKWPRKPPMTLKTDKYEIAQYKKGKIKIEAIGNISLRIFDAEKAEIVFARDFDDSVEESDTYQGALEEANILEDPLDIPTDTSIKGILRNKMVDSISNVILDIFKDREKRYLQWATVHIKRKEYSEAIKFIAQGYLYCQKSQVRNDYSQKIRDLMVNLTED